MQNSRPATILMAHTDPDVGAYFRIALESQGYSVQLASGRGETLSALESGEPPVDAVLLDVSMECGGLDALRDLREVDPNLPVVLLSDAPSTEDIVSAMKLGATDVLCKPVPHEKLTKSLRSALERGAAPAPLGRQPHADSMAIFHGKSPAVRRVQSLVGKIGWSEAPVLIQGETGAGKEVIARELHARSPRANKPFVKLNCAALPADLIESELFGYERGAFTGALQRRTGLFEHAHGGTLLLDEIGDMDFRVQSKLLHVLQDNSFTRVGGKDTINVDVRVMAATHCDLERSIAIREFREDLFYRLNVINVQLPPLRERREDLLDLTDFLIRKHGTPGVSPPALTPLLQEALLAYHWPGNIRELENCVRKFLILRDAEAIVFDLRNKCHSHEAADGSGPPPVAKGRSVLDQIVDDKHAAELQTIVSALNTTYWNRRQAASLLNVEYRYLLSRITKLGIGRKTHSAGAADSPVSTPATSSGGS